MPLHDAHNQRLSTQSCGHLFSLPSCGCRLSREWGCPEIIIAIITVIITITTITAIERIQIVPKCRSYTDAPTSLHTRQIKLHTSPLAIRLLP